MKRRTATRFVALLIGIFGLVLPAAPATAAINAYTYTRSYHGLTVNLTLQVSDDGKLVWAACGLHGGTVRRKIRGCNLVNINNNALTSTAYIDPRAWPDWTTATVGARSTSIRPYWGQEVRIAILFDIYGHATQISCYSRLLELITGMVAVKGDAWCNK